MLPVAAAAGAVEDEVEGEVADRDGSRFDDHLVRNARNAACGLPASGTTSKVRKGKSGEGSREVPPEVLEVWNREWKRIVEPATGHGSYTELRSAVAKLSNG